MLVILGLFALAGGLRIRTPIGSMNGALDRLELPPAQVVAAEERGEHLCFVQCEEWAVVRYFVLEERSPSGDDIEELCSELETMAATWFEETPVGGVASTADQRRYYECGYSVQGLPEHPNWCAEIDLLPLAYGAPFEADIKAVVGIDC